MKKTKYIKYRNCTIAYDANDMSSKKALRKAKKAVDSFQARGIQMSRIELDYGELEPWQKTLQNLKVEKGV